MLVFHFQHENNRIFFIFLSVSHSAYSALSTVSHYNCCGKSTKYYFSTTKQSLYSSRPHKFGPIFISLCVCMCPHLPILFSLSLLHIIPFFVSQPFAAPLLDQFHVYVCVRAWLFYLYYVTQRWNLLKYVVEGLHMNVSR